MYSPAWGRNIIDAFHSDQRLSLYWVILFSRVTTNPTTLLPYLQRAANSYNMNKAKNHDLYFPFSQRNHTITRFNRLKFECGNLLPLSLSTKVLIAPSPFAVMLQKWMTCQKFYPRVLYFSHNCELVVSMIELSSTLLWWIYAQFTWYNSMQLCCSLLRQSAIENPWRPKALKFKYALNAIGRNVFHRWEFYLLH